jgi:hypothetical protein
MSQVHRRLEELVRERLLERSEQADPVQGEVDVAVEQARQQGAAGAVDVGVPVRARPHLDDAAVGHDHVGGGGIGAGSVEDEAAREDRTHSCPSHAVTAMDSSVSG